MAWMVVGAKGMLGTDLVARIKRDGHEVLAVDLGDIDITDVDSVNTVVTDVDVVVNCAAFTAVDPAEENEGTAFRVNATGPANLARRCAQIGARLVQISTDYVFRGDGSTPWGENDPVDPMSAYGRTKVAGEWAVQAYTDDYLIVRTAWLYGKYGNCFPKTMAKLSQTHDTLKVVTDEVGQPTWTVDLADLIVRLVDAKAPSGIYHGTSQGETSWNLFTKEIMRSIGKDPEMVLETTAAAFDRPAKRPSYSALGHDALTAIGVEPIGEWKERWAVAASVVLAD
ncbi:dTDP-4-dehydrorhamnose reductase [Arcanobacterium buesumense]|uniref:dTDP-4-dehydrorhamnose reductase n=1 Tax=Arcanobacterium buesumense TaxID=2722751 RepID=A0A6H2EIW0_9ACTO|nr:dTDP-4-dehydrorhamnose reductase [Arcanobacterium buesumense]QJC21130.1 dTDP-4-dehydrorhamnose reductase [Arcanobacterium buesumense]